MQIVIDIPDYDYKQIKEYYEKNDTVEATYSYIYHGTPLPKGHGRMGDLDALETEMVNGINAGNYEEGYENFAHINNMDDCVECVKYAETIIEADKVGEKE